MRRRMEGSCFRNAFAGGIIHEAKSEIKGTPESIPSDYLDIGNIAGVRECRHLFPEYKGRNLCIRIFSDLSAGDDYSII